MHSALGLSWRWLFVLSLLPALISLIIRTRVREAEVWETTRQKMTRSNTSIRQVFLTGKMLRRTPSAGSTRGSPTSWQPDRRVQPADPAGAVHPGRLSTAMTVTVAGAAVAVIVLTALGRQAKAVDFRSDGPAAAPAAGRAAA